MYQPNYKITDKVLNNIIILEQLKIEASYLQLDYDFRSKLNHQVKSENILHLGHMLNMNFTLREASKIAEGRKFEEESERVSLISSFRNLLEFNRSGVADDYINLNVDSLLHINKVVIAGWRQPEQVRYRLAQESLDGKFEDWINYRLPGSDIGDLQTELRQALDWFQSEASRVNELIRIAILVYRLVELSPFHAGNKYTILGAVDLLTYKYGYTGQSYFPILKTFAQHEQEFWQIWDICQRNHDLTMWVEKFATMLAKDMQESFAQTKQTVGEREQKNNSQPFLDLNKRQLKILRYLQNIPTVQRDDYCQMMDVSTMTAYRDLNDLVSKKLLKVDGQGRGTKYKLSTR